MPKRKASADSRTAAPAVKGAADGSPAACCTPVPQAQIEPPLLTLAAWQALRAAYLAMQLAHAAAVGAPWAATDLRGVPHGEPLDVPALSVACAPALPAPGAFAMPWRDAARTGIEWL